MTVLHIFGAPGLTGVEGQVEIVAAKLVRSTYVTEEETAVNLMDALYVTADPVYTLSANEIAYSKGSYSWPFVKASFVGENSGFTTIRLVVKGTADVQLLIKPNDDGAYEQWATLTGGEDTIVLTNLPEKLTSLLLFVAPNVTDIEGKLEVTEFVAEKGIQVPGEDLAVTYEDKSEKGFYTISEGAEGIDIQYNVTEKGWYYVLITPEAGKVEDVEKLSFLVEGNVKILVKPNNNGALEKSFVLNGEQLVEVPMNADLEKIIFFIAPNSDVLPQEGTLVIKRLTATISAATENVYTTGSTFDVNHFYTGDAAEYTFVEEDAQTTAEYHTTGGWKFFSIPMSGVTTEFNHLKVTLVAPQDVLVTLKPNDNPVYEKHIHLKANVEQTLYLPIPENMTKIIGFIAGDQDKGATGSVVFKTMQLENVNDPSGNIAAALKDTGDNVYTVTPTATGATIAYAKTNQEWANMRVDLIPVSTETHELTVKVTGTKDVKLLVKFNNNNAYENWHTMTGAEDTFVVKSVPAEINFIHVFIGGGSKDISGEIHLEFTFSEKEVVEFDDYSDYDVLDWKPALGYWFSQDSGERAYTLNTSQKFYISSGIRFTKEDIPVGSIIVVKEGYQYRPDGWNSETANTTGVRPAETHENIIHVDEAWWGSYTLRAFNVSRNPKVALSEADFEEFKEAFKIYVPKQEAPLTYTFVDNGENVYTITGDINTETVTVAYEKTGTYNAAKITPSEAIQITKIKVVVSAENGVKLILKPNNDAKLEKNLVLTAEGTVYEWTFDSAIELSRIIVMVAPGEKTGTGTFTITSFEVTLA